MEIICDKCGAVIPNPEWKTIRDGEIEHEHLGGKQYRLTIPGSTTDVEVFVDVNNNNFYDSWTNYGISNQYDNSIGNVQINQIPGVLEGESLTGGTKTITLGTNGTWFQQFSLSGDGMLSDGSTTLPATYNGKACYYTIDEESVPEGYELKQISTDKVQSGVLTAYNQRTSEDVTVSVRKVWEDGTNEDGTPTEHQPSLDVTLSNGWTVTLDAQNQWQATISGLPKYDHDGEEIEYTWTEASLSNGYYQSGAKILVYDDEVITTLTNSYSEHYMPEMEIDGVKVWDDDGSMNRPETITVNLYKDGALYKTTTVASPTGENADPDRWAFRFTNLPVFVADENGDATKVSMSRLTTVP